MRLRPSHLALILTIGLHAGAVFVVALGLAQIAPKEIEAPTITLQLLEQPSRAPSPIQPARPQAPAPPKPAPAPTPAPVRAPAPVFETPRPSLQPTPQPTAVTAPAEPAPTKPAPPVAAPVVPAPPAPLAPPAPPAPPQRTEVSTASYAASNAKPKYPMIAKRNNEQGMVVLRVLVKQDGSAGRVEVKSSSGFERLDRAAVEAVETWHFNPATHDGKPVDEWYQVPIPFKLQN